MQLESSISIGVMDPVKDPAWRRFIGSEGGARIFHHPAWLALLQEAYKFETRALCLQRNGELLAGIPFCEVGRLGLRKRLVCLPFSDHCGPLGSSPAECSHLVDHLIANAISAGSNLEIRGAVEGDTTCELSNQYCLHVLTTEIGPERLFKQLKSGVQRSIKKAQKHGLKTEIRRDAEAVNIFYQLHLKTRKKQGVPIQPRRFFDLFHRHILQSDLGFVTLAHSNSRYISAGVFCGFKGTITYKYGASDPERLDCSPNHLMLWDTLVYARQHGFSRFDFGKTALSNTGLRSFKSGWNTEEVLLPYSYFPKAPCAGVLDLMNKKLVEPAIRHSPAIVCRMAGEGLYKYFGS